MEGVALPRIAAGVALSRKLEKQCWAITGLCQVLHVDRS